MGRGRVLALWGRHLAAHFEQGRAPAYRAGYGRDDAARAAVAGEVRDGLPGDDALARLAAAGFTLVGQRAP